MTVTLGAEVGIRMDVYPGPALCKCGLDGDDVVWLRCLCRALITERVGEKIGVPSLTPIGIVATLGRGASLLLALARMRST